VGSNVKVCGEVEAEKVKVVGENVPAMVEAGVTTPVKLADGVTVNENDGLFIGPELGPVRARLDIVYSLNF